MKRPKLVLDPGHGMPHPGVVYNGVTEADANLAIALAIKWVLRNEIGVDFDIELTRTDKEFVPFHWRTNMPADLMVSIHHDIPRGAAPIYHQRCRAKSAYIAYRLRLLTGARHPVWSTSQAAHTGGRLYIDDAKHPAVLWEVSTIDRYKDDREYRLSVARPIAKAIAEVMKVDLPLLD